MHSFIIQNIICSDLYYVCSDDDSWFMLHATGVRLIHRKFICTWLSRQCLEHHKSRVTYFALLRLLLYLHNKLAHATHDDITILVRILTSWHHASSTPTHPHSRTRTHAHINETTFCKLEIAAILIDTFLSVQFNAAYVQIRKGALPGDLSYAMMMFLLHRIVTEHCRTKPASIYHQYG